MRLAQREKGGIESRHLLSGFLVCRCGASLIVTKRGRKQVVSYVCSAHRFRGDAVCTNTTAVPAEKLHAEVIASLRETFTAESFERHPKETAEDVQAREQRQTERAAPLDTIPKLAAAEAKLAKAIAISDTVEAIVAELKALQQERKEAEARVAELEGWELDARADAETIERLRETWGSWSGALEADPVLARQVLRKVVDPKGIRVFPAGRGGWEFRGYGRYDGILLGSGYLHRPEWTGGTSARPASPQGSAWTSTPPIAGGCDGFNEPSVTDMAPPNPQRSDRPGEAVALLDNALDATPIRCSLVRFLEHSGAPDDDRLPRSRLAPRGFSLRGVAANSNIDAAGVGRSSEPEKWECCPICASSYGSTAPAASSPSISSRRGRRATASRSPAARARRACRARSTPARPPGTSSTRISCWR